MLVAVATKGSAEGTRMLKSKIAELGIGSSGALARSLKGAVKLEDGLPDKITWKLNRYGVFVAKGVGRGISAADRRANKPTKRVPKDWLTQPVDKVTEQVTDEMATLTADAAVRAVGWKN